MRPAPWRTARQREARAISQRRPLPRRPCPTRWRAAGAYSLSESYLYTREAMADYYDHLADGGTLAISRWFSRPPREMERLAALARWALVARGQSPARTVLLQRAGDFGTLLVRRGDFPAAEALRARSFAQANG